MSLLYALIGLLSSVAGQLDLGPVQLQYESQLLKAPVPYAGKLFGETILVADVDGDGFGDVIAVERRANLPGVNQPGIAWIYHGPTLHGPATMLASRQATDDEELGLATGFPPSAAFEDVNADGWPDILLSAVGWEDQANNLDLVGRVHVFLGPDYVSELILMDEMPTENALFGVGLLVHDVDRDGLVDVVVGAPGAPGHVTGIASEGRVWIFWGSDLAAGIVNQPTPLALPVDDPYPSGLVWFGYTIRAAHYDDDGVVDLWIGAGLVGVPPAPFGWGTIYVIDGLTREHVATIPSPGGKSRFSDLRAKRDFSGDGIDDILVAAPLSKWNPPNPQNAVSSAGSLIMLLGPDYTTIGWEVWSPKPHKDEAFGAKSFFVDVDLDGEAELVVGDMGGVSSIDIEGVVQVFHGFDYKIVQTLTDTSGMSHHNLGWNVATGDIDGDGIPEILGSSVEPGGAGSVLVWSPLTLTASTDSVSVSQGGTVQLTVRLPAQAGHVYAGLLSVSGTGQGVVLGPGSWLPLVPDAITEAGLGALGTPLLPGFAGVLNEGGQATFGLVWPPGLGPSLIGSQLTIAVLTSPDSLQAGPASSAVTISLDP